MQQVQPAGTVLSHVLHRSDIGHIYFTTLDTHQNIIGKPILDFWSTPLTEQI